MSTAVWHEYVGNIHLHTTLSDGTGSMEEVVAEAREAGLDFLIPTDHNVFSPDGEGWWEGVLLLIGEEVNDTKREPEGSHYLALGLREDVAPLAGEMQRVIEAVRRQGGLGFLAHPYERPAPAVAIPAFPWLDWPVEGFTGISLWNYMSEFKSYLTSWPRALLAVFFPHFFIRGPFPETLTLWDTMLQERRVPAIGASDAHARTYHLGPVTRVVLPYGYVFRCVNTHVLLEVPFSGRLEQDRQMVYDALGRGHCFVAYHLLGDPKGFRFEARSPDGSVALMGDEVALKGRVSLEVRAPKKSLLRLLQDGREVARRQGTHLTFEAEKPGVYRVEVYRWRWLQWRGWIFSNPIYLRGGSPAGLHR
ncbi:MAG: CehA/McbA family metallohydrolase [Anaerolineae bacterium]